MRFQFHYSPLRLHVCLSGWPIGWAPLPSCVCGPPTFPQQPDELHYAELSIAMPRNYGTASGGVALGASGVSGGVAGGINSGPMLGPNDPLLANNMNPPAYDYFNEPTVYAQIDHFKTMPMGNRNPAMHHQMTVVTSPIGTVLTPTGFHPGQHPSHHAQHAMMQMPPSAQQMHAMDCMAIVNANAAAAALSTQTLKQSPSSYQTIVAAANHPHQMQGTTVTGMATMPGNAVTPTATATAQTNPYSREIVTVRTPLLYTQQESCV